MIEASMISLREGDDEFACSLIAGINIDASFPHPLGIHQSDQLEQKIGLDFEKIRGFAPDRCLKFFRVCSGNTVPRFGFAPVH